VSTKFVAGGDIAFKGDVKFAVDPMGVFDSIEEAVARNHELHSSFGYNIYEVSSEVTPNIIRSFGINAGRKTSGLRVIKLACVAYDHTSWRERP
jgi:hypothetical protein